MGDGQLFYRHAILAEFLQQMGIALAQSIGLFEILCGTVPVKFLFVCNTPVIVSPGIIGLQVNGLAEVSNGSVKLAFPPIGKTSNTENDAKNFEGVQNSVSLA